MEENNSKKGIRLQSIILCVMVVAVCALGALYFRFIQQSVGMVEMFIVVGIIFAALAIIFAIIYLIQRLRKTNRHE